MKEDTLKVPSTDEENLTKEKIAKAIKDVSKEASTLQNQNLSSIDNVHYSDWLALLGFDGEQIAMQYILAGGIKITNNEEWISKIRLAITNVQKITNRKNVSPQVKELDQRFQHRIDKLQKEPTFVEHTNGVKSAKFALVELDKIHCFQKHINTEYVNSLLQKVPEPNDLEGTVKFCLPTIDELNKTEILSTSNLNTNTISLLSENLDFRIIGNAAGQENVTNRNFTGFVYGFGLSQISVVNYNGVFLLKNGYHRAYALLKKGHKFLPCILLETDSFEMTGANRPGFFPLDLILSDKSPLLSDFNTEIATIVPRRRLRAIITMHAELQLIPV